MTDRTPIVSIAGMPGTSKVHAAAISAIHDLKFNRNFTKHYKSGKIKSGDTIDICLLNPKTSETTKIDTIAAP